MKTKLIIRNLPNSITVFRTLLIPAIAGNMVNDYRPAAFALFILACLTDLADGYLARRLDSCSTLGAFLDVISDFLLFLFIILRFSGTSRIAHTVPLFMVLSFFLFLGTSQGGKIIYDPLGKRTGLILALYSGLIILSPASWGLITAAIITNSWLILSMGFRITSLLRQRRRYALHDK